MVDDDILGEEGDDALNVGDHDGGWNGVEDTQINVLDDCSSNVENVFLDWGSVQQSLRRSDQFFIDSVELSSRSRIILICSKSI